jgi:hypothetical protein
MILYLIYGFCFISMPIITRCCTLRRAKNTPTRSFVSNLYISQHLLPENGWKCWPRSVDSILFELFPFFYLHFFSKNTIFSILTMIGIKMKPNIPFHYQKGEHINYTKTRADNSGYTNHRVTCLVVMGSPFDSEQVCWVSFQCLS